jgi:hypothetical protein
MRLRANEAKKGDIRFTGDDISLAATMLDKISTTMEIIYYLMDRGEERSFVAILLSAQNIDLDKLIQEEKRNTDILFEVDKESSIYTIICQDTRVDGGYRFAERIMKRMLSEDAKDIYITQLEVRTTRYDIKYIIFKLLEIFIKMKIDGKEKEIVYNSLQ